MFPSYRRTWREKGKKHAMFRLALRGVFADCQSLESDMP
ncbi:hypothetical protein WCP94_002829 [Bilophila wadsworthia]